MLNRKDMSKAKNSTKDSVSASAGKLGEVIQALRKAEHVTHSVLNVRKQIGSAEPEHFEPEHF